MIIIAKIEVHNSDIIINDMATRVSTAPFTFEAFGKTEEKAIKDLFNKIGRFLPAVTLYNELPISEKNKLSDTTMENEVVRLLHRNISNEITVPFVIYDSGTIVDTGRKRKKCNKYIKIMCKIIREEDDEC